VVLILQQNGSYWVTLRKKSMGKVEPQKNWKGDGLMEEIQRENPNYEELWWKSELPRYNGIWTSSTKDATIKENDEKTVDTYRVLTEK